MIGHCPRYMLASPTTARREPLIHPRQLVDHRCITHRSWSEWLLRSENEDYRYLPDNAHMTDNTVYARECAIAGAGITLLPAFLLEDKIEKGALVKVLSAWSVEETICGWPTRAVAQFACADELYRLCDAV